MFHTQNPFNALRLRDYSYLNPNDIDRILNSAKKNSRVWADKSIETRAQFLQKVAEVLRNNADTLARSMAEEMGKPITDGLAEVEKCASTLDSIAKFGTGWLEGLNIQAQYRHTEVHFKPLGVVLAIMPWNFPLWQFVRFAASAWLAGNVVLLKHADIVAGTAEILVKLFDSIQTPMIAFNLRVNHSQVAKIIADPRVQAVTFTGSTKGGREVAAACGAALKKSVLELGGNGAHLVLQDADLPFSAKLAAKAKLINNGQSCIAAKRFFVAESQMKTWLELFGQELSSYRMGDPLTRVCQLGPLAHLRFKATLTDQCERLESEGAQLVAIRPLQGECGDAGFPPLIYLVPEASKIFNEEELFGPVALVTSFKTEAELMSRVNASPYGLGASIYSQDVSRAKNLGQQLDVGMLTINDYIRSDARSPFGGVKDSGFGRELSKFGALEFCNIQTLGVGEVPS